MLSYMVHNQCKNLRIWTSTVSQIKALCNRETHTKMAKHNIRWAFNTSTWNPTEEEILAASSYIETVEKQRISQFVFLEDAKSALIGRLMLRKFIHTATSIPYEEIKLSRDDLGKPILIGIGESPLSFNISHQGDYAVLAGHTERNIGVDVMKIEPPVGKNVPEFFRLMKRQFSQQEWETIRSYPTEKEQMACFYRFWCLKESYVKNIGLGLRIPLEQLSFSIKSQLKLRDLVTDTTLYEKGVLKDEFVFEESLLDAKHAVAVALCRKEIDEHIPVPFSFLTYEEIVQEAKPFHNPDSNFMKNFTEKQLKDSN